MGWGEPTVHPHFAEYLDWAHRLGLRRVVEAAPSGGGGPRRGAVPQDLLHRVAGLFPGLGRLCAAVHVHGGKAVSLPAVREFWGDVEFGGVSTAPRAGQWRTDGAFLPELLSVVLRQLEQTGVVFTDREAVFPGVAGAVNR